MKRMQIKIQFGDTDPAGIVFYPNYYRWMDAATHELLAHIGYPTVQLLNEGIGFPLVETHCQFKSPGFYHEEIEVQTAIEFVRDKVFKVTHAFYRGETLLAEGYEVRALVKKEGSQLRAYPMPEEMKDALLVHQS